MAVIVKCDLDTSSKYCNRNIYAVVNKKKHPVFLLVDVDDNSVEDGVSDFKSDKNIVALNYVGNMHVLNTIDKSTLDGVLIFKEFECLNDINEDDVAKIVKSIPLEVTCVLKLPDDYKDIEFVYKICHKYANVRFCGGNLFLLEGCNIGICNYEDLEAKGISFKSKSYIKTGYGSALDILPLSSVTLSGTELKSSGTIKLPNSEGASRSKKGTSKATKTSKESKTTVPKKPSVKQKMGSMLSKRGLVDL